MMHQPLDEDNLASNTVRLVSGAVWDFIQYIRNRPDPMIVGKDYPDAKLYGEFAQWAHMRRIRTDMVDVTLWMDLSKSGVLE